MQVKGRTVPLARGRKSLNLPFLPLADASGVGRGGEVHADIGHTSMEQKAEKTTRAKLMLAIVSFGLFMSGVTIWPGIWELRLLVDLVWGAGEPSGALHRFLVETIAALQMLVQDYPFLLYGYDWLAFAHIVLAILFAGAIRDPVRNVWVIQFGLICCVLVPVLAGVFVPIRGLPPIWFLVDFAFAPGAAIPLLIAWHDVAAIERQRSEQQIAGRN